MCFALKILLIIYRAPKDWLKAMHGKNAGWKGQPNYSILVDTRDRPAPQLTYVPQENIEVRRVDSGRRRSNWI